MPNSLYQSLISRLTDLRKYHTRYQLILGIILLLAILSSSLLFAFVFNTLATLSVPVRVFLLGLFLLTLSGSIFFFILRPLILKPTLEKLALKVEERYPHLQDRLISALQLQKQFQANPEGYSLDMIEAVGYQADKISRDLDFKAVVDKRNLRKFGKLSFSLALVLIIFGVLFPGNFRQTLSAFSNPLEKINLPSKYEFTVTPGNTEAVKYADLKIGVKITPTQANFTKQIPQEIKLFIKSEGKEWENLDLEKIDKTLRIMPADKDVDFVYIFKEVKRDFNYYVAANGEKSEKYSVKVVDKPRVIDVKLTCNYPSYTNLKSEVKNENDGNITALVGSRVTIEAKTNKNLEKAVLVFSDGSKSEMKVNDKTARGGYIIRKDASYHIEIYDKNGVANPDPIEYQIKAVPDEFPLVDVIYPGEDRDLDESMSMPLRIKATDDFGFSKLEIRYKINSNGTEGKEKEFEIRIDKKSTDFQTDYIWNLSRIGLIPGDYVSYQAVVWDNDNFSGPKTGESRLYTLRLPTLDEIVAEVEKEQSGQVSNLEEVLQSSKELQKKIENMAWEAQKDSKMNWEKQKEFEAVLDKQKEIASKLEELSSNLQKNIEKIEKNSLVSQEIIQKMQEVQKLMEEVATPELKEAIKKLQEAIQEAMKNVNQDKLREALKNMKFSQEELLSRLERTLELLKRLQAEQKLETLSKMTEELLKKQDEINQKIEKSPEKDLSNLEAEEKKVQKDYQNVQKEMENLEQMTQEMPLLSPEDMQEMQTSVNNPEIKENLGSMCQSLGQCNKKSSSQSGKKLSSEFQKAAEQLKKALAKTQTQAQKELVEAMQKSLNNLLYLSQNQEELMGETKENKESSQQLAELAQQQMQLKTGTEQAASEIQELAKKTSFVNQELEQSLGKCLSNMGEATSKLSAKQGFAAEMFQNEALFNLNQAALSLLDGMNKTCSSPSSCPSGSKGMAQQLQSMAEQQQRLNSACQNLGEGGSLTEEQMAQMERLAAEQFGLQKSLRELEQEYKETSGVLGDLGEIGKEMKEVGENLQEKNYNDKVLQKQNRILTRLLDAQKSLHTQDYNNERKAEIPDEVLRKSPSNLSEKMLDKNQNSKSGLKYQEEFYPKEYEEMIKSYFKGLSEGPNK